MALFGLSTFLAGIGGGLFAEYATFIDPGQFGFQRSAEIFMMVVLGGMGDFLGATLGALVVTICRMRFGDMQQWRMTFSAPCLWSSSSCDPRGLIGARR